MWSQHETLDFVSVRHYNDPRWDDCKPRPDIVLRMLELPLPSVHSLVVSCAPTECALRLGCADGRARVRLNHFTALRSLTLILRRLSPEPEQFSVSLFIPPIYCPALASVTLGITPVDYKLMESVSLTAKDVRDFRSKLREDLRGKLKTLFLRGVSVDDVSALQPGAVDICVRAHEPLTGFVYPENDLRRFLHEDIFA